MTRIHDITPHHRRSARLVAGLALAAVFAVGPLVAPAGAQPRRDDRHGYDHRDWHHDDRHFHPGGYYPAPPVVYGGPVYAPPPVAYGPAIGIQLPGVSIGVW